MAPTKSVKRSGTPETKRTSNPVSCKHELINYKTPILVWINKLISILIRFKSIATSSEQPNTADDNGAAVVETITQGEDYVEIYTDEHLIYEFEEEVATADQSTTLLTDEQEDDLLRGCDVETFAGTEISAQTVSEKKKQQIFSKGNSDKRVRFDSSRQHASGFSNSQPTNTTSIPITDRLGPSLQGIKRTFHQSELEEPVAKKKTKDSNKATQNRKKRNQIFKQRQREAYVHDYGIELSVPLPKKKGEIKRYAEEFNKVQQRFRHELAVANYDQRKFVPPPAQFQRKERRQPAAPPSATVASKDVLEQPESATRENLPTTQTTPTSGCWGPQAKRQHGTKGTSIAKHCPEANTSFSSGNEQHSKDITPETDLHRNQGQ